MKEHATITVIGKDKTGVIAHVTNYLFEQGANIEALEEQVTRGQFSMTLQASWRSGLWRPEELAAGLARLAGFLGMEITFRPTPTHTSQRFAILVTKEPHCLQTVLDAAKAGRLKAQPTVVLGNRVDLKPLAEQFQVPFVQVPWAERDQAEAQALQILAEHQIDFVVLARFMKILSPNFVWRYKNKIINIHPSLLPSFPGAQAYRQAYERGVKIIGVTAHFVTMHLDEGPIIAQDSFPVKPDMNLKEIIARGQSLEARVLLKGLQLYLTKRLDVHWGIVKEV
jgi:formyltetrahydrofolate deformylase